MTTIRKTLFALMLLIGFVTLSGCVFTDSLRPVTVVTKAVEREKLNLSNPPPLNLEHVEWAVVTPKNQKAVFTEVEKRTKYPIIIGVDGDDYKALSSNMEKLQNHIEKLMSHIKQYKQYYKENE